MNFITEPLSELLINFDSKRIPLSSRERECKKGIYPYYGATSVLDYVDEYIFDGTYILLGEDGTVINADGSTVLQLVNGKFWCNNHAHILKNTNKVDFYFLYYLLKNCNVSSIITGAVQPKISQKNLYSFVVSYPKDKEIQQKIAHVLRLIDNKITLNERENNNLEQQAQALFLNIIRANDFDNKLLSEIALIKYGKGLPTNKLTKTGYKVFGGNGIIGYYTDYLYKEPQILISCRGAASGTILVSHPYSYVTNNSLVIELKDRRYFEFLKQYFTLNQLHSYATGSAQPQITIDNLKTVEVPYPDYKIISNTSECFASISNKIYKNICENEKLAQLRDTLLPKLMSGEIDVSKVNISADKLSFTEE